VQFCWRMRESDLMAQCFCALAEQGALAAQLVAVAAGHWRRAGVRPPFWGWRRWLLLSRQHHELISLAWRLRDGWMARRDFRRWRYGAALAQVRQA
jgi:hypothetical protein